MISDFALAGCILARYWLHYHDGIDRILDPEGTEAFDIETLRDEMIRAARDVIASEVQGGTINLTAWIDAEDADAAIVHTLRFTDAIDVIR